MGLFLKFTHALCEVQHWLTCGLAYTIRCIQEVCVYVTLSNSSKGMWRFLSCSYIDTNWWKDLFLTTLLGKKKLIWKSAIIISCLQEQLRNLCRKSLWLHNLTQPVDTYSPWPQSPWYWRAQWIHNVFHNRFCDDWGATWLQNIKRLMPQKWRKEKWERW